MLQTVDAERNKTMPGAELLLVIVLEVNLVTTSFHLCHHFLNLRDRKRNNLPPLAHSLNTGKSVQFSFVSGRDPASPTISTASCGVQQQEAGAGSRAGS